MKKLLVIILVALCLTGCATPESMADSTHSSALYVVPGHYYMRGEVITEDGNIWGYSQSTIGDAPSYNNEPVYVLFNNAGTPNNIYDDEIIGLVAR